MSVNFMKELYWAAGFLEGEGSFNYSTRTLKVEAAQNEREPLERIQRLLGGSIIEVHQRKLARTHWRWRAFQSRAAGIMMTLFSLVSKRRQEQIRQALAKWRHVSRQFANKMRKRFGGLLPDYPQIYARGALP